MLHANHDVLLEKKIDVTLVILLIILLLTVMFEVSHEYLQEKLHKHGQSLVETMDTLFKELTVMILYAIDKKNCMIVSLDTRFYFLSTFYANKQINDFIFGENVVERVAKKELEEEGESTVLAPTVLFELFEDIHIFIFIIMSLFLTVVAFQIAVAMHQRNIWEKFESRTVRERQIAIERNESTSEELEFWGFVRMLSYLLALTSTFRVIQHWRFLHPTIPFPVCGRTAQKFQFYQYLSEKMNHYLSQIIEIPFSAWFVFSLIAVLLRPCLGFPHVLFLGFIAYCGFGVFLSSLLILLKLRSIKRKLIPSNEDIRNFFLLLGSGNGRFSLGYAPIDEMDFIVKNSCIQRCIQGVDHINRQEALFFFGVRGPAYLLALTRLILFANVLLCTVYLRFAFSIYWRRILFHSSTYWIHLFVFFLCAISFVLFWPSIIRNFTFCTSLELFVDRNIVDKINQECWEQQRKKSWKILQYLWSSSEYNKANDSSENFEQLKDAGRKRLEELPKEHLDFYLNLFRTFGTRHNVLPFGKFVAIVAMISPSILCKKSMLETWSKRIHTDSTCAELTQHEFMVLVGMILCQERELSETSTNKVDLFNYVDVDGDGFITLDDLQEVLKDFQPPLDQAELKKIFLDIAEYSGQQVTPEIFNSWVIQVESNYKRSVKVHDNSHQLSTSYIGSSPSLL